jgi:hypothetical protein
MKRITVTLILLLLTLGVGSVMGSGGRQVATCQEIASQIAALRGERAQLQAQLQYAAPGEKPAIVREIKRINEEIANLQLQLQTCQVAACPLATPVTANLLQLTGSSDLYVNSHRQPILFNSQNLTA